MTPVVAENGRAAMRKLSERATRASLVALAEVIERLDAVVTAASVFKVETIGSEYMVVSGLPAACAQPRNTAETMLKAAVAMLQAIIGLKQENVSKQNDVDVLRQQMCSQIFLQIGMERGVVAETILGRWMLPRWKLFGDTVNTASRYGRLPWCSC